MCPFSETNAAPMRTLRTLQAGQSDLNTQARHLLSVRLEFHSLATMTLRKRSSLMASDAANAKRKPPQRQSSDTRYRRKGQSDMTHARRQTPIPVSLSRTYSKG